MKRLLLLLGILASCFATAAFASYPDFTYISNLNSNTNVGTKDISTITLLRTQPVPVIYNISTISGFGAQRYDQVVWTGSGALQVTSPIGGINVLNPGMNVTLFSQGSYTIANVSDSSQQATINAGSEGNGVVHISTKDYPFSLSFPNDVTLDADSKAVSFSTIVNQSIDAGRYDGSIILNNGYRNHTYSFPITVADFANWTMTKSTLNDTVQGASNSFAPIGTITIENAGNSNTNIVSTVTGNGSQFVVIQKQQLLYRNGITQFNPQLQIPASQSDGIFTFTINLSGGATSWQNTYTIIIKDMTAPLISTVARSSNYTGIPMLFTIQATDNIGVSNVTINFGNQTTYCTKDQQNFQATYQFTDIGTKRVEICAIDTSQNQQCVNETINLQPYPILNYTSNAPYAPSRKVGMFARTLLFNVTQKPINPMRLTLQNFVSELVVNNTFSYFTVQIIDPLGQTVQLIQPNQSVTINDIGSVFLEVRGLNVTAYTAIFSFEYPAQYQAPNQFTVRGRFLTYDVPPDFTIDVAGKKVDCHSQDTGDFENSYVDCGNLKYLLTDFGGDTGNIVIPLAVREKKLIDQNTDRIIVEKETQYKWFLSITLILAALAIILTFLIVFFVKIYPTLRIKVG